MDIIDGFLAEEDVPYMSDDLILAIGNVCDEVLSVFIKKYLEDPSSNQTVVERIKNLIGPTVIKNTFHREVIDSGVRDIISNLSLENLAEQELDLEMLLKNIKYVRDNEHKLIASIDPRTKTHFDKLLAEATKYDRSTAMLATKLKYPNLAARINANKRIFYSPNEQPTPTRMKVLINKSGDLRIAEKGIKYLQYCQQANVNGWRRSEF